MDARSVVGKCVPPGSNPLFTAYRACLIALHLIPRFLRVTYVSFTPISLFPIKAGERFPPGRHWRCRHTPISGETPRLCRNSARTQRGGDDANRIERGSQPRDISAPVPNAFEARIMLNARTERGASASTRRKPRVSSGLRKTFAC
jgi:hypothetical protein